MSYLLPRLFLALGLFTALSATPVVASDPIADYSDTCRFFSNAAFQDRNIPGETTFRMQMAQDCIDALVYAQSVDKTTQARAEAYLALLETYRGVIVGMLVSRAQARPAPEADSPGYQLWRPAVHPVSRAGAYLIARDMGLVETHLDWTSWRRAASLPLFRLDEVQTN